jgi:hypothetical protein
MKITLYRLAKSARKKMSAATDRAPWVRFGEDLLVYADETEPEIVAGRSARLLREGRIRARPGQLCVVVQNGRMFQQENPDVEVIHDRGRYLLVKLDERRAGLLKDASPTCYGIFPLRDGQVVFDVVDSADARSKRVAWVDAIVGRLDRPSLDATLTHLVSFKTRHSTGSDFKAVSTWARDQLKAMGYATRFQAVEVGGSPSRNLIADRKGQSAGPRKVVLVTAHLDSINIAGGPSAPAPGADDNGSGSAGVIEMARAFSNHKSKHDLRFILFGGEEQGLFGSLKYVSTLSATEKARILSVVNMDMVGTLNTATRSVMLEGAPLSQRVIDGLSGAAATYTNLKVETSLNPFASDHVPFIRANIPAVLTIEGADSTNGNIHSAKDTINHINYDFSLEILRMNVAFVAAEIGRKP